jgi:hypothetical protein
MIRLGVSLGLLLAAHYAPSQIHVGGASEYQMPWGFKGERLYYLSCGLADECWEAKVREPKTKRLVATLRCDGSKLFYSIGANGLTSR